MYLREAFSPSIDDTIAVLTQVSSMPLSFGFDLCREQINNLAEKGRGWGVLSAFLSPSEPLTIHSGVLSCPSFCFFYAFKSCVAYRLVYYVMDIFDT